MRWANKPKLAALLASAVLITAIPAISQEDPKSLLPPGFGDPPADVVKPDKPVLQKPVDLLPDLKLKPPTVSGAPPALESGEEPTLLGSDEIAAAAKDAALMAPPAQLQDLPASARRSTARIGILGSGEGDLGAAAFGSADGKYLESLMRSLRAPVASRWASILLRRALLSTVDTPRNLNGADWAAERAWLLLRMGEADSARLLIQGVDADQFTPKLFQVAMQSSLANSDPAGLCPLVEPALKINKERAWQAVRAICSGLSGESAQASAQIDAVRSKGSGQGIDGLLAEKVVGAGGNTRRAVVIEWDNVSQLTAWRYGMATATGIKIPDRLMASVGAHVHAWAARAPLLPAEARTADAEIAAVLGVFSSAALVDHYGAVADATDAADARGKPFLLLRTAYAGAAPSVRIDALRALWESGAAYPQTRYAKLILTARAAARLKPNVDLMSDADNLLESMLSAGLDLQAARWATLVSNQSGETATRAWGLLSVGTPGKITDWGVSAIKRYQSNAGSENAARGQFLFAGMAGLGRMSVADATAMADDLSVSITKQTRWTKALNRAVLAGEPGTVVLLCAVGLQNPEWKAIPAVQLFHIVSALRRVGLASEARMIAAEALTRS